MLVDPVARMLAMPSLLLAMVLLCWPLLFPHPDDAIATLVWEPDLREMWLATAAGQACQVERICFSCSLAALLIFSQHNVIQAPPNAARPGWRRQRTARLFPKFSLLAAAALAIAPRDVWPLH